jgi:hypothetical protein
METPYLPVADFDQSPRKYSKPVARLPLPTSTTEQPWILQSNAARLNGQEILPVANTQEKQKHQRDRRSITLA